MKLNIRTDVLNAKQEAVKQFLRPNYFGNVVGVGIGNKVVDGTPTPEFCVRIYVVEKLYPEDLTPAEVIPSSILGIPTDVIETGRFGRKGRRPRARCEGCDQFFSSALQWLEHRVVCKLLAELPFSKTHYPGSSIRIKSSAPNVNSGLTGTFGAVLKDADGKPYMLSCNHVLAMNGRVNVDPDADIVSAEFVGSSTRLAKPGVYIPLDRAMGNTVDCAAAPLAADVKVVAGFPKNTVAPYSVADAPGPDSLGQKVKKVGAATGLTQGNIVDVDADLYVDYSFGTFRFEQQIMIDGGTDDQEFATAGDSGSVLVLDGERQLAAGMIFAGSGRFAVACPLADALAKLGDKLPKPLTLVTN